jgi:hypothetical protein
MNFTWEFRPPLMRGPIATISLFTGVLGCVGRSKQFGGRSAALFWFHGLLPEIGPVALHRAFFR